MVYSKRKKKLYNCFTVINTTCKRSTLVLCKKKVIIIFLKFYATYFSVGNHSGLIVSNKRKQRFFLNIKAST